MEGIGRTPRGGFIDQNDRPIELIFKLYPWEFMLREPYAKNLVMRAGAVAGAAVEGGAVQQGHTAAAVGAAPGAPEPAGELFRGRCGGGSSLGGAVVRKPLFSREGANVTMVVGGNAVDQGEGPYGAEGFVRQAVATLPKFQENYAAIGSWIAGGKPCGLSVREELGPITKNTSRFLPHAIVG